MLQVSSLDILNEAVTQLLVGFGIALLNVVVRYFTSFVPDVITVLHWPNRRKALIVAYLIALVLQMVTSPFFVSAFQRVYTELAWSPYQAVFNVVGVLVMDIIIGMWRGAQRGAQLGREQFDVVKERAAETLGTIDTPISVTPEQRAAHAAQQQAATEAEAQVAADRKKRIDDRLKDY